MGMMKERMKARSEYEAGVKAYQIGIGFNWGEVSKEFGMGYQDAKSNKIDKWRMRDSDRSGYIS